MAVILRSEDGQTNTFKSIMLLTKVSNFYTYNEKSLFHLVETFFFFTMRIYGRKNWLLPNKRVLNRNNLQILKQSENKIIK